MTYQFPHPEHRQANDARILEFERHVDNLSDEELIELMLRVQVGNAWDYIEELENGRIDTIWENQRSD